MSDISVDFYCQLKSTHSGGEWVFNFLPAL